MKDSVSFAAEASLQAPRKRSAASLSVASLLVISMTTGAATADELRTGTGERLVGKTVSVTDKTIVFSSATLGKVTVARSNVVALTLSSGTVTNPVAKTNLLVQEAAAKQDNGDIAAVLRSLPAQPGLAEGVSADMLAQAGPEATDKFNQMLRGLLTGKMSASDLRAEAQSVRDQARAIRADLGDEAGVLDGYLAILDKFLAQTPPAQNKTPTK